MTQEKSKKPAQNKRADADNHPEKEHEEWWEKALVFGAEVYMVKIFIQSLFS